MSRLILDSHLCEGSGLCVATMPNLFAFDGNSDTAVTLVSDLEPSETTQAEVAASLCPVRAIRVDR